MRVLNKLKLLDDIDYYSSVSGGSWFTGIYLYSNTNNDRFLCKSVTDITLENLKMKIMITMSILVIVYVICH